MTGPAATSTGQARRLEPPTAIRVITHSNADRSADALREVVELAKAADVQLAFDRDEHTKHGVAATDDLSTSLCLVIGGDGTIMRALQATFGTDMPVLGINVGQMGFLAAAEREHLRAALDLALAGRLEIVALAALEIRAPRAQAFAVNDVALHRHASAPTLACIVGGVEVARSRCDGLVASSPAGSTGYNLANGGPPMAWGAEGTVISFIAPQSPAARPLVIAPDDPLTLVNRSRRESANVTVDGHTLTMLDPGEAVQVSFTRSRAKLARLPDTTFYGRLTDKFGPLGDRRGRG